MKLSVGRRPVVLVLLMVLIGCGGEPLLPPGGEEAVTAPGPLPPVPKGLHGPPELVSIPIPYFPGSWAIWGSTGRDSRGHIWFGVSAHHVEIPSARLFEFIPASGKVIDRGDVVSQLKRCGVWREGEGQMKIHSKFYQATDGHLYFASMDEQGERVDGSQLPTWGSHLWRLRLPEYKWEHLMSAPEGLIALGGRGHLVYTLGYFTHKLYQFNCKTGKIRSVEVGALGGHVSRNFLVDRRGHAYVPRITRPDPSRRLVADLVEFDTTLKEVASTRLEHYFGGGPIGSHGIVGLQMLKDGSLAFLTHVGRLYLVRPVRGAPAEVADLGWFHPRGRSYTPSLFLDPSRTHLLGLSRRRWVVYDLEKRSARTVEYGDPTRRWRYHYGSLYGSVTRDKLGNYYVAGSGPRLVQIRPPWSRSRRATANKP